MKSSASCILFMITIFEFGSATGRKRCLYHLCPNNEKVVAVNLSEGGRTGLLYFSLSN